MYTFSHITYLVSNVTCLNNICGWLWGSSSRFTRKFCHPMPRNGWEILTLDVLFFLLSSYEILTFWMSSSSPTIKSKL